MSGGTRGDRRSRNSPGTASVPQQSPQTGQNECRLKQLSFNARILSRRSILWNRTVHPRRETLPDYCLEGLPRVGRSRHSAGFQDFPGRSRHTPSILQPRRRIRRSWIAFLVPFRHSLHNRPFLLLGCRAPVDDLVERTQAPYANKASLIEATTVDARRNDCLGTGR